MCPDFLDSNSSRLMDLELLWDPNNDPLVASLAHEVLNPQAKKKRHRKRHRHRHRHRHEHSTDTQVSDGARKYEIRSATQSTLPDANIHARGSAKTLKPLPKVRGQFPSIGPVVPSDLLPQRSNTTTPPGTPPLLEVANETGLPSSLVPYPSVVDFGYEGIV